MNPLQLQPPRIDRVTLHSKFHTTADVLRLDEVHPVVSGNKWFKLRYYIDEALHAGKSGLLTYGGAWSNHILATAAAARFSGLSSLGIIRGEEPEQFSSTLLEARSYGMEFFFLSRHDYRHKILPAHLELSDVLLIPEGGSGPQGVRGAASILHGIDTSPYTHLLVAAGTGATLAGLITAAGSRLQLVGIPVIKGDLGLKEEIKTMAGANPFHWFDGFHFGGYARKNEVLIRFMNRWFEETGIPSDFVYTGKLFYAFDQLLNQGYFPPGSRVLLLHTGGLQGNRSLPKGTLIF